MDILLGERRVFAGTGGRGFDAALPAVVFLHGAGMDHSVWALQSRYFAHHGRSVLALDLPGHGRSEGPALESVEAMADWLHGLLEALGIPEAALVGHSMGSAMALETAARYPQRVRALVLLGAAAAYPVHPDLLAAAESDAPAAVAMITSWGHGQGSHLGGHRLPGTWLLGSGERLLERAKPGVLLADLAACAAYEGGLAAAAKVRCPALVLIGAEDRMTPPKAGRRLAESLGRARTLFLPDCGHMPMTEKPEATLDALKAIL